MHGILSQCTALYEVRETATSSLAQSRRHCTYQRRSSDVAFSYAPAGVQQNTPLQYIIRQDKAMMKFWFHKLNKTINRPCPIIENESFHLLPNVYSIIQHFSPLKRHTIIMSFQLHSSFKILKKSATTTKMKPQITG